MSIRQITTDFTGEVGVHPRVVRIQTDDSLATVSASNYLKNANKMGFVFYPSDLVVVSHTSLSYPVTQIFTLSITLSSITLVPLANLISFDVTVGQAALANGGSVVLVTSNNSEQYRIRSLQLNSGGTNFSGGGGDRLGQVTDGTTVYSVIPAASLQTLANAQWGDTALPNPASAAINTLTASGADLVFKYSGGTTDYTAGSLVISGLVERIV